MHDNANEDFSRYGTFGNRKDENIQSIETRNGNNDNETDPDWFQKAAIKIGRRPMQHSRLPKKKLILQLLV
jgi:hypothetical protein